MPQNTIILWQYFEVATKGLYISFSLIGRMPLAPGGNSLLIIEFASFFFSFCKNCLLSTFHKIFFSLSRTSYVAHVSYSIRVFLTPWIPFQLCMLFGWKYLYNSLQLIMHPPTFVSPHLINVWRVKWYDLVVFSISYLITVGKLWTYFNTY